MVKSEYVPTINTFFFFSLGLKGGFSWSTLKAFEDNNKLRESNFRTTPFFTIILRNRLWLTVCHFYINPPSFFHQDIKSLIIQLAPPGGLNETSKIPIFPSIVIIKFKRKEKVSNKPRFSWTCNISYKIWKIIGW